MGDAHGFLFLKAAPCPKVGHTFPEIGRTFEQPTFEHGISKNNKLLKMAVLLKTSS
jgi:hypothetical protein